MVELHLAKVDVVGSNPIARSILVFEASVRAANRHAGSWRVGVLFLLTAGLGVAEEAPPRRYPILVLDDPPHMPTQRQVNENFLSVHRWLVRALQPELSTTPGRLLHLAVDALLFLPLTHEEAHRSVLTREGIAASSRPWFGRDGTARVTNVRDDDLQRLRDRNLPTFVRLHTAGLESDARIAHAAETLAAWGAEDPDVLWSDHAVRRLAIVGYHAGGLFGWSPDLPEESDERERDVVGHDVYGMIRHLHRPEMPFRRYTEFDDLTPDERRMARRIGARTWVNLASPLLFGRSHWAIDDGARICASLAYGLTPFGDMFEQNFWRADGALGLHLYLREYQNRAAWFPAAGIRLAPFDPRRRVGWDLALHVWRQPRRLAFDEADGTWGCAADLTARWRPLPGAHWSVDVGALAKTEGHLPEAATLGADVVVRAGVSWIW